MLIEYSNDVLVEEIRNTCLYMGYDAKNNVICQAIACGIVDPLKVVRVALENAASVASMVLTTECLLSTSQDMKEYKELY
jgi:chaperonin GroEL